MRTIFIVLLFSTLFYWIVPPVSAQENPWRSLWEFRHQDLFFDICAHPGGGAFLVGTSALSDYEESSRIWALALDTDGGVNQDWGSPDFSHRFGANDVNVGYGACATDDNQCVIVGASGDAGGGIENLHGFFLRINKWKAPIDSFVTVWPGVVFYDVIQSSDGGFIAVGEVQSQISDIYRDIYIFKVDQNLNTVWFKTSYWENPNNYSRERGLDLLELPDGRIVVSGSNLSAGGRLLLLSSSGSILNSYWNADFESYTDVEFLGSDTSIMSPEGTDTPGDSYIIALGSYAGYLYTTGGSYSSSAVVIEYVVPANHDYFAVIGDPHIIAGHPSFTSFRLHNIHPVVGSFVMTGYAQLDTGKSAAIVGVINSSFQSEVTWTILTAELPDANINSYATWMDIGSLIFSRGCAYDCMLAGARHRWDGFGGENHKWHGEAFYQPVVARTGGSVPILSSIAIPDTESLFITGNPREGYEISLTGISGQIDIDVYDLTGRVVCETSKLIGDETESIFSFGSTSELGSRLSNGVYVMRFIYGTECETRSLVIAK